MTARPWAPVAPMTRMICLLLDMLAMCDVYVCVSVRSS